MQTSPSFCRRGCTCRRGKPVSCGKFVLCCFLCPFASPHSPRECLESAACPAPPSCPASFCCLKLTNHGLPNINLSSNIILNSHHQFVIVIPVVIESARLGLESLSLANYNNQLIKQIIQINQSNCTVINSLQCKDKTNEIS